MENLELHTGAASKPSLSMSALMTRQKRRLRLVRTVCFGPQICESPPFAQRAAFESKTFARS